MCDTRGQGKAGQYYVGTSHDGHVAVTATTTRVVVVVVVVVALVVVVVVIVGTAAAAAVVYTCESPYNS
jgi:hypothetical protein